VTSAADAAGAVEELRNAPQPFDLVITDLFMPKISGITVLSAIKTAFADMEVIVITAFGDEATQSKAMQQGAFAFIHKPLDLEEFFSLVERALKVTKRPRLEPSRH
jgi:DNA-binding NtrC family response regulator